MTNRKQQVHLDLYKDTAGEWRWHIRRKGRILCASSEGYKCRRTMRVILLNMINSLKLKECAVLCEGKPFDLWGRM